MKRLTLIALTLLLPLSAIAGDVDNHPGHHSDAHDIKCLKPHHAGVDGTFGAWENRCNIGINVHWRLDNRHGACKTNQRSLYPCATYVKANSKQSATIRGRVEWIACKSPRPHNLFPMSRKLGTFGCYHLGNGPQASWEIEEYDNGIYVGQFNKSGKRHGQGVYRWDSGRVYDGNYNQGTRQGQGTMTFPDGNVYSGNWTNGKIDGKTFATLWREEVKEIKRKKEHRIAA